MPRPIIVAHRGLHAQATENSWSAFCHAVDAGLTWVECDVWVSKDGHPVIIHDETLDRTTTGVGLVSTYDWRDLQTFTVKALGSGSSGEPLIGIHDLATLAFASSLGALVEIKPADAPALVAYVIDTLNHYRNTGKADHEGVEWILQSFHSENLIHALVHDHRVVVAMLVHDRPSLDDAISAGWDRIHLDHALLDHATADRLHAAGVRIGCWTVNEPGDIRRVMALGVEMLITDQPFRAQYIADEMFGGPVPSSGTPGEG